MELAVEEFNTGHVKDGKLSQPNSEHIATIKQIYMPSLDAQKIKTKLDNL